MTKAKNHVDDNSVRKWVHDAFGEKSTRPPERIRRFLEEALELVQAEDITKEEVIRFVDFIWDRPKGEPLQEVGGVMLTLRAYCVSRWYSVAALERLEWARVQSLGLDHFRERQKIKADAGLSLQISAKEDT